MGKEFVSNIQPFTGKIEIMEMRRKGNSISQKDAGDTSCHLQLLIFKLLLQSTQEINKNVLYDDGK